MKEALTLPSHWPLHAKFREELPHVVWHRIGTHSILDRPLAEGHLAGAGRPPVGWLSVTLNSVVSRSCGQDLTTAGTYIEMTSRLTAPLLLGLAVLAVRNRVRR